MNIVYFIKAIHFSYKLYIKLVACKISRIKMYLFRKLNQRHPMTQKRLSRIVYIFISWDHQSHRSVKYCLLCRANVNNLQKLLPIYPTRICWTVVDIFVEDIAVLFTIIFWYYNIKYIHSKPFVTTGLQLY